MEMKRSESIKEIAAALMKFQSEMQAIKRDSKNPHFRNTYTSISAIIDAIRQPLAKVGLSFSQLPIGPDGLVTILMHPKSGEFLQTELNMKPTKDDPQGRGSALTYMRRYSLTAILGLNEEDDDGNEASQAKPRAVAKPTPQSKPQPVPQSEQKQPNRRAGGPTHLGAIDKPPPANDEEKQWLNKTDKQGNQTQDWQNALDAINQGQTLRDIAAYYKINKELRKELTDFIELVTASTPVQ